MMNHESRKWGAKFEIGCFYLLRTCMLRMLARARQLAIFSH